jgi:predicted extracellular nuclease
MSRTRTLLAALAGALLLVAPTAHAASSDLVVAQIYAGGGNSGATYQNDYVELFNRGGSTVDLTGWSLQYASASSTSWSVTVLSGNIPAGRHYLVELASTGSVGSPLPTADAIGTTNIAASGGKLAIVHDTSALACGASPGTCSAIATIHDLVGYGSATDYEGSAAAPALSATEAAVRAGSGCTDTDSSSGDFTVADPEPHNSLSTVAKCASGSPAGATQSASVAADVQSVLGLGLEKATLSFGSVAVGQTPASLGEKVTVTSTGANGYALSVHRTSFSPADLPLGIGSAAPSGGQVNPILGGGALAAVPIAPAADLLLGTTSAPSAGAGDLWATSIGFVLALPSVPSGHYTSTVTYTVIGR